jgi:UDP-glucose 6-dehydrogenase
MDLSYIEDAAEKIGNALASQQGYHEVVIKRKILW